MDRRFLLLEQLALAGVGLVAIPDEWNVAAGHHHATFAARKRIACQRGGRYRAKVYRAHSSVPDGSHDRRSDLSTAILLWHKTGGTGTQVPGKEKLLTADDSTFGGVERLQVFQFRKSVDIDLQVREIHNLAPPSAGPELQLSGFVFKTRSKRAGLRCYIHLESSRWPDRGARTIFLRCFS